MPSVSALSSDCGRRSMEASDPSQEPGGGKALRSRTQKAADHASQAFRQPADTAHTCAGACAPVSPKAH